MNPDPIERPASRKPLRLWPGVTLAILLVLIRFVVPLVLPDSGMLGALGGLAGALLIVLWWLFFSRAAWIERLGAVLLMAAAILAAYRIAHPSIAGGAMGMLLVIYAVPVLCLALVAWTVASRRLTPGLRRATLVATLVLAAGVFALIRTGGISGAGGSDFQWRWSPTPEERLLAQPADKPAALPAIPAVAEKGAEWPGFRGPERDGIARELRINTDWAQSPPVQLWRQPVGPGWSSFAVRGDFFYTQEQRGDDEVVACYKVSTGEPVWRHRDAARFWESNAGAGPRATPTLHRDRVYTLGATGLLNALDASDGKLVWSRNAAADTGTKVPGWGFAGSPLVIEDLVIVATAGKLAAYDLATGQPRWFGPAHGGGYSSPHRLTLAGVEQVLLLSNAGLTSVAPANGTVLWEHTWPGASIVQPTPTADGDVLVSTGGAAGGIGVRRLAVAHGSGGWIVSERWTSRGLKPYFNDMVIHQSHAFGFDGSILGCIDLKDGGRKWKGGRYGNGQLVLLPEQDLLLVLSEQGELALVGATPEDFKEIARCPAIKGKTWNHPALAGDVLLVRNSEEAAAFRLPLGNR